MSTGPTWLCCIARPHLGCSGCSHSAYLTDRIGFPLFGSRHWQIRQLLVDAMATITTMQPPSRPSPGVRDCRGEDALCVPRGVGRWNHACVWLQGATVVALTSGANMNFDRLRLVADLANYGQRTEAMLTLSIPERSGEFRRFVESLYDGSDDEIVVTECKYRFSVDRPAKMLFSLAARSPEEVAAAVERLRGEGYACRDVTGLAAAQVHLRHMVGGRPRSYTGSIEHEKMVVVRRCCCCAAVHDTGGHVVDE